jgi:hypothetical protein
MAEQFTWPRSPFHRSRRPSTSMGCSIPARACRRCPLPRVHPGACRQRRRADCAEAVMDELIDDWRARIRDAQVPAASWHSRRRQQGFMVARPARRARGRRLPRHRRLRTDRTGGHRACRHAAAPNWRRRWRRRAVAGLRAAAFRAGGDGRRHARRGLSGPRRQAVGAVRDFVLGVKLLNGLGEVLSFGGQVMKNVAGYDVPRCWLAASARSASCSKSRSRCCRCRWPRRACVLRSMKRRRCRSSISGAAGHCRFRRRPGTTGADAAPVGGRGGGRGRAADARRRGAGRRRGGGVLASLREQTHAFFAGDAPLWRLSLPSVAPPQALGPTLIEWGGAQRWLRAGDAGDPRGGGQGRRACDAVSR